MDAQEALWCTMYILHTLLETARLQQSRLCTAVQRGWGRVSSSRREEGGKVTG